MSHGVSDTDIQFVETLLEQLQEKTDEAMSVDTIDPVTLCATVSVIAKIALLVCSILNPAEFGKP